MEIDLGKAVGEGTGASAVGGAGSVQYLIGLVETGLPEEPGGPSSPHE